ncbi:MAG: zinc ribbon domain-containing protein [Candidatus Aminicenantes bacterium]|nr:zinc ribbon domain-containing protein [Candidatus Aminicenantes bacterium]
MIKCASCAFENPDDGKFCTGCGQALVRPPAVPDGPAKFCTECGAKIPADSKFCTACGKGFAPSGAPEAGSTPTGPVAGGAGGAAFAADYLAGLDGRLAAGSFEKIEPPAVLGLDRFLRRKKFELAQIGMVTAVCGVKVLSEPATAAYVKDYSRAVFEFANAKKGFFARNAVQQLLVYPVLIAPAVDAGVAEFLGSHWPKHWMGFEFTVVVSLGTRELLMHRSTPVWQALSHSGFKKQAESLFAI